MKKYILDNLPTIWVVAVFVLGMAMVANHANANEEKTITPQEFVSNVVEVPGKLVKFIGSEVEKTKSYQAKSWADMKTKWPFTMIKKNATQD